MDAVHLHMNQIFRYRIPPFTAGRELTVNFYGTGLNRREFETIRHYRGVNFIK